MSDTMNFEIYRISECKLQNVEEKQYMMLIFGVERSSLVEKDYISLKDKSVVVV
jgi:hypothetical protein